MSFIDARSRQVNASLALMLTVPVSTLGAVVTTIIAPGRSWSQGLFLLIKLWLVAVPIYWTLAVDGQPLSLPRPTRSQIGWGIALGLMMFGMVVGAYDLLGEQWINLAGIRAKAITAGIVSPWVLLGGAIYWCLVNAFVEEAVWRSFIFRKWAVLVPASVAVWLMGLCFTLHHAIVLWVYTQDIKATALSAFGVFSASVVWSICYLRSNSLWPGYISHILADVAIALVAYEMLFDVAWFAG